MPDGYRRGRLVELGQLISREGAGTGCSSVRRPHRRRPSGRQGSGIGAEGVQRVDLDRSSLAQRDPRADEVQPTALRGRLFTITIPRIGTPMLTSTRRTSEALHDAHPREVALAIDE
jgi:hypothetical protein